jgi:hypothetical protein
MAVSAPPSPGRPGPVVTQHKVWIALVVTGLIIGAAFIAVYVGLQRSPTPHHLPLAVVGAELSTTAQTGLGDKADITQVATLEAGAERVRDGDAVGVVGASSPGMLQLQYAGAAGFSESGAARSLVAAMATQGGAEVKETDIVPLVKYDTRGLVAFYVVFGVTLASFVLAQGLIGAIGAVRLRDRILAMSGFAIAIGLIGAFIAGPIYGSLAASFPLLALCLILLSAASAFSTTALGVWLGPAGVGLAVLALTTVGNATSGATIGYDLLPGWAQFVSDKLPPGAAVRSINNFGYFDGAHTTMPLVVLGLWIAVGLGLVLLRQRVAERRQIRFEIQTTMEARR